jgi:hypothetical protein
LPETNLPAPGQVALPSFRIAGLARASQRLHIAVRAVARVRCSKFRHDGPGAIDRIPRSQRPIARMAQQHGNYLATAPDELDRKSPLPALFGNDLCTNELHGDLL